jgi:hypothetical protein
MWTVHREFIETVMIALYEEEKQLHNNGFNRIPSFAPADSGVTRFK